MSTLRNFLRGKRALKYDDTFLINENFLRKTQGMSDEDMLMTVAQNKTETRSRELKTPVRRGLQYDTSHLPIPNFQRCVSGSQGARTRIPFRIARPRISIALSGNAVARGVANGERESGSISRKPNS